MPDGPPVTEQDSEALHQELDSLLQELRIFLPGVEVLFGFLLTIPFSQRFAELAADQKGTYFVAFISAAVASILLIAPSAMHRIERGRTDVRRLLRIATRLALLGTAFLAVATTASVFLITELLTTRAAAVVAGTAVGLLAVLLWYALPTTRRYFRWP